MQDILDNIIFIVKLVFKFRKTVALRNMITFHRMSSIEKKKRNNKLIEYKKKFQAVNRLLVTVILKLRFPPICRRRHHRLVL